MTIIFDSQMYPDELACHFKENVKGALDYAAHNLSKAIYYGLKENGQHVRLVNIPNLGSFPVLYKKTVVKGGIIIDGESLTFWNIPKLKLYSICKVAYQKIKKEISLMPEDEDIVILLYNAKLLPIVPKLKKLRPTLKVCMIVTDLPEYMVTPNSVLYKIADSIIPHKAKFNTKAYSYVDGYVLLAPQMSEKLPIEGRQWIQMEGIYESTTEVVEVKKSQYKAILYTGNLSRRYGIIELLDAFGTIESQDYRLWLRGGGDCEDVIRDRMKNDDRITLIPPLSRDELIRLQKEATVLVNPVSPSQRFTNYFFPSKTLEYLASGTPVVMYHLSCLPKEYDDHIYYIEEDSVVGIKEKLIEICSKKEEELQEFGKRASSFILRNKKPKMQMSRVIEFIRKL